MKSIEERSVARLSRSMPEINFMGAMQFDPLWGEIRHPARGLELLHLLEGRMDLVLSAATFHASPGDTLLVPREELHVDAFNPEEGLSVFYCSLNWAAESEFLRLVDNTTLQSMSAYRRSQLIEMFDQLRSEESVLGWGDRLLVRSRLQSILMFMVREAASLPAQRDAAPTDQHRRRLMNAARAYLRDHYAQRICLEDVARAVNVSTYYLSHLFSQESEFSLFGYLTALRVEAARNLFRQGDKNVSQVARAVGYHDPNYFSKVFKKHTGFCPKDFQSLTAVHYPGE